MKFWNHKMYFVKGNATLFLLESSVLRNVAVVYQESVWSAAIIEMSMLYSPLAILVELPDI